MVQVFFSLPLQLAPVSTYNIFNLVPTTAAAEVTNALEWLTLN